MSKFALINESECIGCTKCLQVCPFDAIIGATKQMHTVLKTECPGCELCIPACPVDCISLVDSEETLYDRDKIKQRKASRTKRLQHTQQHKFANLPETTDNAKKLLSQLILKNTQK